jgi:hypothetical protein
VPELLTVPEARTALRLKDTDPKVDELLQSFIAGVTSIIESYVGWVTERTEVIEIRQGGCEAVLPGLNVISLTAGVYVRTGEAIDVSSMYVSSSGILRLSTGGNLPLEPWRLTASVGMSDISQAIKRAAAEVLIEAWATQRQTPPKDLKPFLVPNRARAWLVSDETGPAFA